MGLSSLTGRRNGVMDQSVTTLGIPAEGIKEKTRGGWVTETAILAFITGLIYTIAGSYQLGYQDQFGFTYISLGIEDIIAILREFLIPILVGGCVALIISFVIMFFRQTSTNSRLINVFLLLLPLSFCLVFYISFGRGDHLSLVDKEVYWLLAAYYLLDPVIWGLISKWFRSSVFAVPRDYYFRFAQAAVASLLLTVISYSIGVIDARNIRNATRCPDFNGKGSILVQMTKDLAICAETDFDKKTVHQNILYFKIPDNGSSQLFHSIIFHPDFIAPAEN